MNGKNFFTCVVVVAAIWVEIFFRIRLPVDSRLTNAPVCYMIDITKDASGKRQEVRG